MATEMGLPRATFAKLSPHAYLLANLTSPAPARSNTRHPSVARPPLINSSSLTHAHGSSIVRLGSTTVICGIRGETLPVSKIPSYRVDNQETELREYDLLVPNIEMATGCAVGFLPGTPPGSLVQGLSTRVYSLLHASGLINPADLRIRYRPGVEEDTEMGQEEDEEEKDDEVTMAYWVLYIDLFFISLDGNPFDAAWTAILTALKDTRLPRATWDADLEMPICSRETSIPLSISGFPVACTAVVFNDSDMGTSGQGKFWLLLDPDMLEEKMCKETVTVVVDKSSGETVVLAIEKVGGTTVSGALLVEFIEVAERRWEEVSKAVA